MAKKASGHKPEITVRELPPKVKELESGVQVLCPFCEIPHPIEISKGAACGTIMQVMAVQTTYPVRTVNKHNLICIKCRKSGGEMVRFNNGYVHLHECSPNTKLLATPPVFTPWAQRVYNLPKFIRTLVEKYSGYAKEVKEIDQNGKETGKVLGYFFFRGTT